MELGLKKRTVSPCAATSMLRIKLPILALETAYQAF